MVVSFRSTLEIWVALEGSIDKRPVWATGLITSVYRSKCGGWTGGPIAISHRTFESSMCPTPRPCSRDGGQVSRRLPGNVAWVLPSHTGLVLSKTSNCIPWHTETSGAPTPSLPFHALRLRMTSPLPPLFEDWRAKCQRSHSANSTGCQSLNRLWRQRTLPRIPYHLSSPLRRLRSPSDRR